MYLAPSREVQAEVLQEAFEGHRVWVAFQPDLRPSHFGLRAKKVQEAADEMSEDETHETLQSLEQGWRRATSKEDGASLCEIILCALDTLPTLGGNDVKNAVGNESRTDSEVAWPVYGRSWSCARVT